MILESVFEVFLEGLIQSGIYLDTVGGFVRYVVYNSFYYVFDKDKRKKLKHFYKAESNKKTDNYDLRFANAIIGLVFITFVIHLILLIS